MSNLLAAVGRAQLQVLVERIQRKQMIFDYYQQALGEIPGIDFMPEAPWGRATRWLSVIKVDPTVTGVTREDLRLALETSNIESRPVWKPMHLQPVFRECEAVGGTVAEELFVKGLCLPSGTAMNESDMERVVNVIKKVIEK